MARFALVGTSIGGGGIERVLVTLANHWANDGHDITVLTFQAPSGSDYPLASAITHGVLGLHGESSSKLDAVRLDVRRVRALRSSLKATQPDAIVAFGSKHSIRTAVAAWGLSAPVVGSVHTNPDRAPVRNPIRPRISHWGYALPSTVVAVSNGVAESLRQKTKVRRVEVIHNPLDERHLAERPADPEDTDTVVPTNGPLILGVGRLVPAKGFESLIKAFVRVADQRPQWRLVIVGDGPQRESLADLARANGLGDRVEFPGWVEDTTPWYQAASVFALPSRWEGFAVALVEALSHGLPAVAADCDYGPREILTHGQDGYLVDVDDIDGLADRLAALMDDPQLRAQLGSQARTVRERYRTPAIAKQWEKLFSDLGVPTNA